MKNFDEDTLKITCTPEYRVMTTITHSALVLELVKRLSQKTELSIEQVVCILADELAQDN